MMSSFVAAITKIQENIYNTQDKIKRCLMVTELKGFTVPFPGRWASTFTLRWLQFGENVFEKQFFLLKVKLIKTNLTPRARFLVSFFFQAKWPEVTSMKLLMASQPPPISRALYTLHTAIRSLNHTVLKDIGWPLISM